MLWIAQQPGWKWLNEDPTVCCDWSHSEDARSVGAGVGNSPWVDWAERAGWRRSSQVAERVEGGWLLRGGADAAGLTSGPTSGELLICRSLCSLTTYKPPTDLRSSFGFNLVLSGLYYFISLFRDHYNNCSCKAPTVI